MKKNKYQVKLFIVWSISYLVILLAYLFEIQEGKFTSDDAWKYFLITSGLIFPQLGIILSFFFETNAQKRRSIEKEAVNSGLAFYVSLLYILLYTLLIVVGVHFKSLFGWGIDECTNWLVVIMGHLSVFAILANSYLFKENKSMNR